MVKQSPKKRISWSLEEDLNLKSLVSKFPQTRSGWKQIAIVMQAAGYDRNTKACRERFNYQLNSYSQNSNLQKEELVLIMQLMGQHGNKWSEIALKMKHRNNLNIKNKFYSSIRKIFRRLIKAVYKTKESSKMISQIKSLVISSMFCISLNEAKLLKINQKKKDQFKQLIINHYDFDQGLELDLNTIQQVRNMMSFLKKIKYQLVLLSQTYLLQKTEKQLIEQQNSVPRIEKVESRSFNKSSKILQRIQVRKPLFRIIYQEKQDNLIMQQNNETYSDEFYGDQNHENESIYQMSFYSYRFF